MTEEQIRTEWIPKLQQKFQEFMPPIDKEYPKIYFTNDDNDDIAEAIEQIEDDIGTLDFIPLFATFAEYLHGESGGSAILIYLGKITEDFYPVFAINFWEQLGYFYLFNTEPQEWLDFYNMSEEDWDDYFEEREDEISPELDAKFSGRYGYHVWHSFAASAIARLIGQKYDLQIEPRILLDEGYISEEMSGEYLASLFVYNVDDSTLPMPDNVRYFWNELKKIVEPQYRKDSFWILDEKVMQKIGETYMDLELQFTINSMKRERANLYNHVHVKPIAPSAGETKKKKKSKRKAQKQARKKNRK